MRLWFGEMLGFAGGVGDRWGYSWRGLTSDVLQVILPLTCGPLVQLLPEFCLLEVLLLLGLQMMGRLSC